MTQASPELNDLKHIAIIMDGNGRWAKQRRLPRVMGHQQGAKAVRTVVQSCVQAGLDTLTLFAFSSENWRRPEEEISVLMDLLFSTLQNEVEKLDDNNIKLRFIGDVTGFPEPLQNKIQEAENLTRNNSGLNLMVALNYGGRWDMTQACRRLAEQIKNGSLTPEQIDSEMIETHLTTHGLPEPDLFIRTGGEQRISNFLLWQLAYTELYFTPTLWPDFDQTSLADAIADYQRRQRRFGRISEQLSESEPTK